jgi:hypothetical protein
MGRVHFDWHCRERPALALRLVRDPLTRLRRTRVKSIEDLGQRLLPILRLATASGDEQGDGGARVRRRLENGSESCERCYGARRAYSLW